MRTSGHRRSGVPKSIDETHIPAVTQATFAYHLANGISGPLYLGKDSHALSDPAERSALEVLAANGVETVLQDGVGLTPTPAVSRAILEYNAKRDTGLADGLIITPSHNPPADGGIKYNPPQGGPADTDITQWIEQRAT